MKPPRIGPDRLTVIIRNDSPFIHLGEPPKKRTVILRLTELQREILKLAWTGSSCGVDHYEEISEAFFWDALEGEKSPTFQPESTDGKWVPND